MEDNKSGQGTQGGMLWTTVLCRAREVWAAREREREKCGVYCKGLFLNPGVWPPVII